MKEHLEIKVKAFSNDLNQLLKKISPAAKEKLIFRIVNDEFGFRIISQFTDFNPKEITDKDIKLIDYFCLKYSCLTDKGKENYQQMSDLLKKVGIYKD